MSDAIHIAPSPHPSVGQMRLADIPAVLAAGWHDFRRAPLHGLALSAVFVLAGIAILLQLDTIERSYTIIPLAFGFPLLAPFFAMGLYDVSRGLENGEVAPLRSVLRVIYRQKDRQCPSMAAVMVVIFLFWIFIAHMIFALFLGYMPMMGIETSWGPTLLTPNGISMLVFGTAVGAVHAFVLFSISVMGLPLLLDREIDFITAMILSFKAVMANIVPMMAWGIVVAALTLVAMIPAFLGLLIVLPVLGHATWHLYRRVMVFDA